jgi:large subunit ribosomal protein L30
MSAKKSSGKKVRIKLVKSLIGRLPAQRKTIKALGLGKINSTNEIELSDPVKGMIKTVSHMIEVTEL